MADQVSRMACGDASVFHEVTDEFSGRHRHRHSQRESVPRSVRRVNKTGQLRTHCGLLSVSNDGRSCDLVEQLRPHLLHRSHIVSMCKSEQ